MNGKDLWLKGMSLLLHMTCGEAASLVELLGKIIIFLVQNQIWHGCSLGYTLSERFP